MHNPTQLAKLVRPSAGALIGRPRLYARLDAIATGGRVVWICGPAGAGKSSLVVGWTHSMPRTCAWYQLDERDGDPASFFHYLALLQACAPGVAQPQLPQLRPEYLVGLGAFARRFFEAFYAGWEAPFTLVLDNLHELPSSDSVDTILKVAIEALPAHGLLVVISRADPAPALARCVADPGFHLIGQEDLLLDDEEACRLAQGIGLPDDAGVRAINERVRGWAAGLVLLLRARSTGVVVPPQAQAEHSLHLLFGYIATEIFGRTPAAMRDFLLRTAALPYVPVDLARTLTGREESERYLQWLHAHRLLTTRRPGTVNSYEYHPLFRDFLLQSARAMLDPQEWVLVRRRAAQMLQECGEAEPAASLWIETESWDELAALTCSHAGKLMAQGRLATLALWLQAIPQCVQACSPWLLYWSGMCANMSDPVRGRPQLEAAYALFRSHADRRGTGLTLAGILSGYFLQWGDLHPVDRWIPELDAFLQQWGTELPLEEEVQLLGACTVVMMRSPGHPRLEELSRRASQLIEELQDPALRFALVAFVMCNRIWYGDYAAAQILCDDLARQADANTPVFARLFLTPLAGCILWQQAEHERAHAVLRAGLQLADESGIHLVDSMLCIQDAYVSLSEGDAASAEAALDRGAAWVHPGRQQDVIHYRFVRAGVLLLRGELERATAIAHEYLQRMVELGSPFGVGTFRIQLGQMLMLAGRHAEAQEQFTSVLSEWRPYRSEILCFQAGIALGWSCLHCGDDAGAGAVLREALAIGARRAYMNCHPWWLPHVMSEVCARALAEDIESEYVRRLIARRGLEPPRGATPIARWPWPIRVRTLGTFEVRVGDRALKPSSKAQKKPLELLKAVVAHGSSGVAHGLLADQLWPELEGDGARNALHTTLHRLRRLLGEEQAIVVREGMVGLDETRVWTDMEELERLLARVDAMQPHPAPGPDRKAPAIFSLFEQIAALYAGDFLAHEEVPEWALRARARIHGRYIRACANLAQLLEAAGAYGEACSLHARVLEIDPVSEEFHRGLIRSLAAQGRVAEALEAYHRCRTLLAGIGGAAPSEATEALVRSISPFGRTARPLPGVLDS